jgi:putative molybdopterin biosynthesis protein
MASTFTTRLRDLRLARGWSQTRLGELAGITRQSVHAIESGRSIPSTEVALRLAEGLDVPVESLFGIDRPASPDELIRDSGLGAPIPGRVRIARVGGTRWAYGLDPGDPRGERLADGTGEPAAAGMVRVSPLPWAPPEPDLVVAGCDPAFGLVKERLRLAHGIHVLWLPTGSRRALEALAGGAVHVAGMHLADPDSGEYNAPWVQRLLPLPATRISFATWEQALLLRRGNPLGVRRLEDLTRPGLRFVNREEGSGSRALLERRLSEAGIAGEAVPGFLETEAGGHEAVASAIGCGAADAGVAIRAVGDAQGLEALPLGEEPYELVIPEHFLQLPAVETLLGLLGRPGLRRQVETLGGYDASAMGRPA